MALDEPNEADEKFEVDGYQYIINKDFLERVQPVTVDFHMYGFKLDCNIQFGGGCSCGSDQKSRCGC